MAGRYTTLTYTTATIAAGATSSSVDTNQSITSSQVNIVKIKVVPNTLTGPFTLKVYKSASLSSSELLSYWSNATPQLFYPSNMASGTAAEGLEGYPIVYDDDDSASQIHLQLTNNDTAPHTYTVTVKYEIAVNGLSPILTSPQVVNGIGIGGAASTGNSIVFYGTSSGAVTVKALAAAGTWTWSLPNSAGTASYPLITDGSGNASWTLLPLAGGGTGAALTASNGGIFYSTGSVGAILPGTATAGQILQSGSSAAPAWSTATYPAVAGTANKAIISDGTNFSSAALSLASAQFANQGTTTTVLHGNAAGNPSFAAVSLTADISGILAGTSGGTGVNNGAKTFTYLKNISFTAADDTGVYTLPTGTKTLIDTTVTTLSSLVSIGTITAGVWNGTAIIGTYGGTGVNNGAKTFTYLKNISFTAADDTGVYTLPTGTKTLVDTTVATLSSLASVGTITTGTWSATAIATAKGGTGLDSSGSTGLPYLASAGVWTVGTSQVIQLARAGYGTAADATALLNLNGAIVHGSSSGVSIGTTTITDFFNISATTARMRITSSNGDGFQTGYMLVGGATNASWTLFTNNSANAAAADDFAIIKNAGTIGTKFSITDSGNVRIWGVGPHVIGGSVDTSTQLAFAGNFTGAVDTFGIDTISQTLTGNAGREIRVLSIRSTLVEAGSGTHALIAGIVVAPSITNGAATATDVIGGDFRAITAGAGTTNNTTIRVAQGSGATNNYAINITSGDIYKNGSAYTNPDYAIEMWATGKIEKFAKNAGADQYKAFTLNQVRDFAKANYYLPQLDFFKAHDRASGGFERSDISLILHEDTFRFIWQHDDEIRALKARLKILEGAA